MLKVKDYYVFMNTWAPKETAMEGDNVGLLFGSMTDDVNGVLIALDITQAVIEEAKKLDANLIIAHHPIIFGGLNAITCETASGKICLALMQNSMNVICAHTNLDAARGGVSDALACAIGLLDITPCDTSPLIRVGKLHKTMDINQFALHVKNSLNAQSIRISGNASKPIATVAVSGGSAGQFYNDAMQTNADIYLVGAAKHHEGLAVSLFDFCMMEAGHYETEVVVLQKIQKYLQNCVNDIQSIGNIDVTSIQTNPFKVLL